MEALLKSDLKNLFMYDRFRKKTPKVNYVTYVADALIRRRRIYVADSTCTSSCYVDVTSNLTTYISYACRIGYVAGGFRRRHVRFTRVPATGKNDSRRRQRPIYLQLCWDGALLFKFNNGLSMWPLCYSIMNLPPCLRNKLHVGGFLLFEICGIARPICN